MPHQTGGPGLRQAMFLTVSASESFSLTYFLPFIVFPVLFFLAYKLILKYLNERILIGLGVVSFLVFGSLKLIFQQSSYNAYKNKTAYLIRDVIKFHSEKNQLYGNHLFERED